jgi:hypothetical protein
MIKVKNTDQGPRGIVAGGETVMLMPGETRDLDVTAGDLAAAKRAGWFAYEGEAQASDVADQQQGDSGKDFADYSDDELRDYLKTAGVAVDGRWKRDSLLSEAKKTKA